MFTDDTCNNIPQQYKCSTHKKETRHKCELKSQSGKLGGGGRGWRVRERERDVQSDIKSSL